MTTKPFSASETQMFGCSTATVKEDAARYNNPTMYVMSTLSDAQEMVATGDAEGARQAMNRAKYVTSHLLVAAPKPAPPAAPEFPMLARMTYHEGTTYTSDEADGFKTAAAIASAMYDEDAKKVRDSGTCTLGAGICVRVRPPRSRTRHVKVKLVAAGGLQGNVGKYEAALRAYSYLRAQGIDCYWDDGAID